MSRRDDRRAADARTFTERRAAARVASALVGCPEVFGVVLGEPDEVLAKTTLCLTADYQHVIVSPPVPIPAGTRRTWNLYRLLISGLEGARRTGRWRSDS